MCPALREDKWVWVVVQEPEKNPQYLGQHDDERDISFIPVFLEKDHALLCYNSLKKDKLLKYEIQAVLYEELLTDAQKNGFLILILDGEGKIVEWIEP
jgi:hypothetical protein